MTGTYLVTAFLHMNREMRVIRPSMILSFAFRSLDEKEEVNGLIISRKYSKLLKVLKKVRSCH